MKLRLLMLLGALVCAAPPLRAQSPGAPTRLAVLEFETAKDLTIDRTYFSDLARGAVHKGAPGVFVMTRESTEALLASNGKTMADCTGECEVEVGRKLGADFIVSGRITQVGSRLSLTMRLFSTADGQLVESVEARGKSQDDLLDHVDAAMEQLVAPLAKRADKPKAEPAKPVAMAPPPEVKSEVKPLPPPEPKPVVQEEVRPAPPAALPPPANELELKVPPQHSALHRHAPALFVGGVVIGGASLAFDNLSSTSKDGKLGAIDFLPIAGYALALALLGAGIVGEVKP